MRKAKYALPLAAAPAGRASAPIDMKQESRHRRGARLPALVLSILLAGVLAGCGGGGMASAQPDQGQLCEVNNWHKGDVAKACKPGQKVVYLPESWGNEQLPVIFAAVNCDLRYQVALTRGAVTCIYAALADAQPSR